MIELFPDIDPKAQAVLIDLLRKALDTLLGHKLVLKVYGPCGKIIFQS